MKYTSKGFLLPEETDFFNVNHVNQNAQKSDDLLVALEKRPILLKTAAYTIVAEDLNKTITVTGNTTITLTAIAILGLGFRCRISNIGIGIISVVPSGTDTIAKGTSITIYPGKCVEIVADYAGMWTVVGFDFTSQIEGLGAQITNLDAQKATKTELATTNAIVEQKADKSEVTNVMTPKGNISYASLPITGNTIGWYYYCSDGDGVNGAGNYVWNGVSWYFGGTGDEGYNIVREDLGDNFSEHDGIVEHDNSTNLIDRTTFTNGYIIDGAVDGQPLQISNFQVSDFFRVEPNKTYYFGSFFGGYYAYYDRTKKYIGGCGNSNGANYLILSSPFTTPSNADIAYMRITLNSSVSTQKPKNAWMNETNWSADSTITTANYPVKSNKLKNDVNLNSKHLSMINNIVNGIDDNPCNYKGNEITVFKKIVCIGDSITQGTFNHNETGTMAYMTSNDYSYPNYLTKLTGIVTDNMGRGGYTSVQFQEAYVNHDWSGVDCAIINFGINDALQGVSADDSRTALRALIDSLKGDNINIKIFIATVVPAYADGVTTFNAINDTIRYLAETTPDVYLIDLTKYSHVNKDTVYEAGHLTALGYCRLAKDYISAISSIIKNNIDDFKYVAFIGTNYTYNV